MKTVLIAIVLQGIAGLGFCQAQNTDMLCRNWNIKQVKIDNQWQTIVLREGEQGPFLWLKKNGEAELFFMLGISKAKWKYEPASKTLTITEPEAISTYIVEALSDTALTLKSTGNIGSMDPKGFQLQAQETKP